MAEAAGHDAASEYLGRDDVRYEDAAEGSGSDHDAGTMCTPLYRAVRTVPDDFTDAGDDRGKRGTTTATAGNSAPTVRFVSAVSRHCPPGSESRRNRGDGDSPLALLYRRYARQYDESERFFPGDNSRPEVLGHRRQYRSAASNTWEMIRMLLLQEGSSSPPGGDRRGGGGLVHAAVPIECPPDLLRYIVEIDPEGVKKRDEHTGRLPLHVAAVSGPPPPAAAARENDEDIVDVNERDRDLDGFSFGHSHDDLSSDGGDDRDFIGGTRTGTRTAGMGGVRSGTVPLEPTTPRLTADDRYGVVRDDSHDEHYHQHRHHGGQGHHCDSNPDNYCDDGRRHPESDLSSSTSSFPAYYSKFVIDELLYSYPGGARERDGAGMLPLSLALEAGKGWIAGGCKSLYHAYPEAMDVVDAKRHPGVREVMARTATFEEEEEDGGGNGRDGGGVEGRGSLKDDITSETDRLAAALSEEEENGAGGLFMPFSSAAGGNYRRTRTWRDEEEHHDAVMLVQRLTSSLGDVVGTMWANEDDGGVQLLGCMAICRIAEDASERERGRGPEQDGSYVVPVALTALSAVVNAMKCHPNEPAVQERACRALAAMALADGRRECSYAACGALAAAVAAMQAHVSDAAIQAAACAAIGASVDGGGEDRATVVASVSGFTALMNALGAHPEEREVQREGCRALEALTRGMRSRMGKKDNGGGPVGTDDDDNDHERRGKENPLPELKAEQAGPLLTAAAERFPDECEATSEAVLERLT